MHSRSKDNYPVMGCLRGSKENDETVSFLIRFPVFLHLSRSRSSQQLLEVMILSKTFMTVLECTVVLKDNTPVMGCLRSEAKRKVMQKCSVSNTFFLLSSFIPDLAALSQLLEAEISFLEDIHEQFLMTVVLKINVHMVVTSEVEKKKKYVENVLVL
ncbi:hypothetical protein AVEN_93486-1 [Araneus ventricosus]|uniref:Uncharacterized protein n=1 Tax=Araneus ventricosus TaxID=182803 RepID=A0A4Y2AR32_ARAVE|nr:hypothetical protein AVEN_93486-1 [Araneus ventricosus]